MSGCEWGNLLLWEGGMIKCEIAKKAPMGPEVGASVGKSSQRPLPVHTGGVTVVLIEDGEIITAGEQKLVLLLVSLLVLP